jgi:hypothetical protein
MQARATRDQTVWARARLRREVRRAHDALERLDLAIATAITAEPVMALDWQPVGTELDGVLVPVD